MRLAVRRLTDGARLPTRAYEHDAALDLCAAEATVIPPGGRTSVGTGLELEISPGHAGLVLPRSGLAARRGIALVNAPGLIDPGFRGELRVLLLNTDREESFPVAVADRIAQLLVVALPAVEVIEASALTDSERGARGFGSSG